MTNKHKNGEALVILVRWDPIATYVFLLLMAFSSYGRGRSAPSIILRRLYSALFCTALHYIMLYCTVQGTLQHSRTDAEQSTSFFQTGSMCGMGVFSANTFAVGKIMLYRL